MTANLWWWVLLGVFFIVILVGIGLSHPDVEIPIWEQGWEGFRAEQDYWRRIREQDGPPQDDLVDLRIETSTIEQKEIVT